MVFSIVPAQARKSIVMTMDNPLSLVKCINTYKYSRDDNPENTFCSIEVMLFPPRIQKIWTFSLFIEKGSLDKQCCLKLKKMVLLAKDICLYIGQLSKIILNYHKKIQLLRTVMKWTFSVLMHPILYDKGSTLIKFEIKISVFFGQRINNNSCSIAEICYKKQNSLRYNFWLTILFSCCICSLKNAW